MTIIFVDFHEFHITVIYFYFNSFQFRRLSWFSFKLRIVSRGVNPRPTYFKRIFGIRKHVGEKCVIKVHMHLGSSL